MSQFSFFVYFTLLASIYILVWIGVRFSKDKMSFPIVLALAVYTIVIGVRYSLGDDFQSYLTYYQSMARGNEYDMYFESGFKYICRFFSFFEAPSYYIFSFFALLNVFAIFLFYKRNGYYLLLPLGFFFFFTNDVGFSLSLNVLRQFAAFSIFLISLEFLFKRRFISYLLLILFASLFHKSALICLFFYFIQKDIITNRSRFIILVLLSFSFAIGQYIIPLFDSYISSIVILLGIGDYSASSFKSLNVELGSGLGLFSRFICSCIIIFYSPKLKIYFKNYSSIFNIFLIGVFFKTFFCTNLLLLRSIVFPMGLEFILSSMLCYYLFKIKYSYVNVLIGIFIVVLNVTMLYLAIKNNSNMINPYIINPDLL